MHADVSTPPRTLPRRLAEYELTAAFFNDMRAQADKLDSQTSLQNAGGTAGAMTSVEVTLRQMDEVVERLDTLVRNKYRDDPAQLAAWESAPHVERAPRSKPKEGGAASPPSKHD